MKMSRVRSNSIIWALLIVLIAGIVMVPITSNADDLKDYKLSIGSGVLGNLAYSYNGLKFASTSKMTITHTSGEEYTAYCIQSDILTEGGNRYNYDSNVLNGMKQSTINGIEAIMDIDLTRVKLNVDGTEVSINDLRDNLSIANREYLIKQHAIWYLVDHLDGYRETSSSKHKALYRSMNDPSLLNDLASGDTLALYKKYLGFVKQLAVTAQNGNLEAYPSSIVIDPQEIDFTYNQTGGYYESELITAFTDGVLTTEPTFDITCVNSNIPNIQYSLVDKDGDPISKATMDGFKIRIDKQYLAPGDTIEVTVETDCDLRAYNYGYFNGNGVQNLVGKLFQQTSSSAEDNARGTITKDKVYGSVDILKVDAENPEKTLDGAEFTLYDADGKIVDSGLTANGGIFGFDGLEVGYYGESVEYTLTETKSPEGYEDFDLFTTTFALSEEEDEISFEFTVENIEKVYGAVEVLKIDSDDRSIVLEGAEFTLYDAKGEVVTVGATDVNGIIKFEGLDVYGETGTGAAYKLVETKAPEGYIGDMLFEEEFTLSKGDDDKQFKKFEVTNLKAQVLGEQPGMPVQGEGQVLPDFEDPTEDEESVLGEEAKTGDTMSLLPILIAFFLMALILSVVAIRKRDSME